MASIRITQFGGLIPELASRIKPETNASIAHNCILEDGTLRPQAKWVRQAFYAAGLEPTIKCIAYDPITDRAAMYTSHDVVLSPGEPFPHRMAYGATLTPPVSRHQASQGLTSLTASVYNYGISGTVSYTRAYLSTKPVNRVYALSRVRFINGRREEGALAGLIGDPYAVVYEGDDALLDINFTLLDDGATHIRIYRSVTGLDTGETVNNDLDTEWQLVDEVPTNGASIIVYVDGGAISTDPLDANFSQQFHPPTLIARFFGLTESGWFVAVSESGEIHISERYMPHAWPSDNILNIQETVTDIAIHKDNIYIGTKGAPYIVSVAQGDKATQVAAVRYDEVYPCIKGSMTPSASGALYASTSGVIALGREGLRVVTGGLSNPGAKFYTRRIAAIDSPNEEPQTFYAGIGYTNNAIYLKGKYYGFCGGLRTDLFYLTTTLYPYYFVESFGVSGDIIGAALDPMLYAYTIPTESIDVDAEIVSGTLRAILKSYVWPHESIEIDGGVVEGMLKDILVTYSDWPYEAVTVDVGLVSITLRDILVSYTTALPEDLEVSGQVLGGTLV